MKKISIRSLVLLTISLVLFCANCFHYGYLVGMGDAIRFQREQGLEWGDLYLAMYHKQHYWIAIAQGLSVTSTFCSIALDFITAEASAKREGSVLRLIASARETARASY